MQAGRQRLAHRIMMQQSRQQRGKEAWAWRLETTVAHWSGRFGAQSHFSAVAAGGDEKEGGCLAQRER